MGKQVRVFLSHSTDRQATDDEGRFAAEILAALYAAFDADEDFEPLLDYEKIPPGGKTRELINEWIYSCDVAVPIFSVKALESSWVAYEVSNFTLRHDRDDRFMLVPVVLREPNDLKSAWRHAEPTRVFDLNSVRAIYDAALAGDAAARQQCIDDSVAAVLAKARTHARSPKTPAEEAAKWIELHLGEKLKQGMLEELAQAVGLDAYEWTLSGTLAGRVAVRMLQCGLGGSMHALNLLDPEEDLGSKRFEDVVRVLGAAWVNRSALDDMARCASGDRVLASPAQKPATPDFYVWARTDLRPTKSWLVVEVSWVAGALSSDEQREALLEDVFAALATRFGDLEYDAAAPDKDAMRAAINQRIAQLGKRRTLIVLQGAQLDADSMDLLRLKVPDALFFLLGSSQPRFDATLTPKQEEAYLKDYNSQRDALLTS